MTLVFVVSREPRMRTQVTNYLRDRGYDTATAEHYDEAMETLPGLVPGALVIDVQGVPRGEDGTAFPTFSQWLERHVDGMCTNMVYLLRKGSRRPNFRIAGTVIKKPFPIEALGEALREQLGHPRQEGHGPGIDLDLNSNTLRGAERHEHLTTIEANLLAYLMQHEGEVLHPRDLLMDVWQYHNSAGASTLVRAHISNLRRKLRSATGSADYIQTVRTKGYRFSA